MTGKIFTTVVVAVAVILAVLAVALPLNRMHDMVLLMRFFETMVPVLAVGALLKYITGVSSC